MAIWQAQDQHHWLQTTRLPLRSVTFCSTHDLATHRVLQQVGKSSAGQWGLREHPADITCTHRARTEALQLCCLTVML